MQKFKFGDQAWMKPPRERCAAADYVDYWERGTFAFNLGETHALIGEFTYGDPDPSCLRNLRIWPIAYLYTKAEADARDLADYPAKSEA